MLHSGTFYQFDERLRLLDNSFTSPNTVQGSTADFNCPNPTTSFLNSGYCTRSSVCGGNNFDSCGSPGEVSNDPTLGGRYYFGKDNSTGSYGGVVDWQYPSSHSKSMVWLNAVFKATDRLRQRVAWSIAQFIGINEAGLNFNSAQVESYMAYYDIFVRNALGNFRQILKEVSYNPSMGSYLTFMGAQSFASSGNFPDENYAREIMQLFSIGLCMLNEDGSLVGGSCSATYTNEDIVAFSRIWTGFVIASPRSNLELLGGKTSSNYIDPMLINPRYRDIFPKTKLQSGYIGDSYPLCDSLPAQHWLKPGATYTYTGSASIEGPTVDAQDIGVGKNCFLF